jgi:hypothetical protein
MPRFLLSLKLAPNSSSLCLTGRGFAYTKRKGDGEKPIDSKKRGLFYFFLPMDEISSKRMKEAIQFVLGYSTCKLNLFNYFFPD